VNYPVTSHPHGEARWATPHEIRASGIFRKTGAEFGLLGHRSLHNTKGGTVRVTGSSGSGKTSQVALPLILSTDATVVLLDFKNGEISRTIEPRCALEGRPLYAIDPFGVTDYPPTRISLLSHLTPNSPTLVPDSQRFWRAMVPETGEGNGVFFDLSGQRVGDIITRMAVAMQGSVSLQTCYTLLLMLRANPPAFFEMADSASDRLPPDVIGTIREIENMGEGRSKTLDDILAGMLNRLAFMAAPQLMDTFVDSELADVTPEIILGNDPVILSLVIPDELVEVLSPLIRAFISGVRTAKKARPDTAPVIVLADEVARLGKFDEIEKLVAVDRSAGLVPFLFYQDDGQIARNLGPNGKTNLEANTAISIDLGGGIRDYATAKSRSDMLGYQTVVVDDPLVQARAETAIKELKRKVLFEGFDPIEAGLRIQQLKYETQHSLKMRKPMMAAEELLNLPSDKMLVQARGYHLRPFIADKRPYYVQKRFAGQFFPNPNEDADLHSVRVRTLWGMRKRAIKEAPLPSYLSHLPQYGGSTRPFRYVDGFMPKPPKN
jgi:type IV secretion system protein VirD4